MSEPVTVLIAASDLIPVLKARAGLPDDALAFPDSEPLEALEAIGTLHPSIVVLERFFAATPRGAALISRLRDDPAFSQSEIRVVSHDTDYARIVPRRAGSTSAASVAAAPEKSLDNRGTRRAPRYSIREGVGVLIDGNRATLGDLSSVGAKVISDAVLRPNRKVRMTIMHADQTLRITATIMWASFEMSQTTGAPQYRAGLEFISGDTAAIEAFCQAHQA